MKEERKFLINKMDPAEIEFLAEKGSVKIVPNFTSNTLYLLEGDVGPFNAGLSLDVPIWLATDLRQRQKCRILQPDWMDIEKLEETKEIELNETLFTELPNPQLFVTANLILDVATSDIAKADKIKTIIKVYVAFSGINSSFLVFKSCSKVQMKI